MPVPKPIPQRQDDRAISMLLFRLNVLTNLITQPFNARIGARHDISLSQWRCLTWLAARPGCCGQDTARGTGLDRMSVSRNLRALEHKGRVSRIADPTNKKRWLWSVTDEGWAIYDAIIVRALERDRLLTETLADRERSALAAFLDAAAHHFEEYERGSHPVLDAPDS